MPLYEYECAECQHYWEQQLTLANRTKPTEEKCPNCGTMNTISQVLTGAPGFGDPIRLGLKKPNEGHRDILREMKRKLDTKYTKTNINVI